jgi:23S rRNA pseudouridine1911/1915/1917 synthase
VARSDHDGRLPLVRPEGIPEDAILRVLRVPPENAGMRVDVFVQSQLRNTSRTRARQIVEKGAFSPQGRRLRANDRVRAEDRVVLWRVPFAEKDISVPPAVVFEDEHLLVVDKPAPMAVHPTARHYRYTVTRLLAEARPDEFHGLVHRIDRETSGLLILAKSPEAERRTKRMIEDRADFDKTYLAITWGVPPTGLVDAPLELDADNSLRVKMRIASPGEGLDARTGLTVLERKPGYALCECVLHTGRQHQIRLHLASLGAPIVGDKLYGPDERLLARAADGLLDEDDLARLELPRHALHAHRYRFEHAMTGEMLELESPLAADLATFWQSLA